MPLGILHGKLIDIRFNMSTADENGIELLSDYLLRLGGLARDVPAPDFMGRAVQLIRTAVDFQRGWWGFSAEHGPSKGRVIYQAEYLNLPESYLKEWSYIAPDDDFAIDIAKHPGIVQRYSTDLSDQGSYSAVTDLKRRYTLFHGMGICFDDAPTGHRFFIAIFRDKNGRCFDEREAVLFLHLVRHTLQLWGYMLQDSLKVASTQSISCIAVARGDGRIVYVGPNIFALLLQHWPNWEGGMLPCEMLTQVSDAPVSLRFGGGTINISPRGEHIWLLYTGTQATTANLSPREWRVAQLFASGYSYKEIAKLLSLKPSTVRTYLRDAYLRLGISNKSQLESALGPWV